MLFSVLDHSVFLTFLLRHKLKVSPMKMKSQPRMRPAPPRLTGTRCDSKVKMPTDQDDTKTKLKGKKMRKVDICDESLDMT